MFRGQRRAAQAAAAACGAYESRVVVQQGCPFGVTRKGKKLKEGNGRSSEGNGRMGPPQTMVPLMKEESRKLTSSLTLYIRLLDAISYYYLL